MVSTDCLHLFLEITKPPRDVKVAEGSAGASFVTLSWHHSPSQNSALGALNINGYQVLLSQKMTHNEIK